MAPAKRPGSRANIVHHGNWLETAPAIVLWTLVAAALSETANAETVPSASQPPPDVLTTRITVTAFGSRNTPVIRSAIVRFGSVLPRGYEVLAWQDGS